jgi:hypothetical protein
MKGKAGVSDLNDGEQQGRASEWSRDGGRLVPAFIDGRKRDGDAEERSCG